MEERIQNSAILSTRLLVPEAMTSNVCGEGMQLQPGQSTHLNLEEVARSYARLLQRLRRVKLPHVELRLEHVRRKASSCLCADAPQRIRLSLQSDKIDVEVWPRYVYIKVWLTLTSTAVEGSSPKSAQKSSLHNHNSQSGVYSRLSQCKTLLEAPGKVGRVSVACTSMSLKWLVLWHQPDLLHTHGGWDQVAHEPARLAVVQPEALQPDLHSVRLHREKTTRTYFSTHRFNPLSSDGGTYPCEEAVLVVVEVLDHVPHCLGGQGDGPAGAGAVGHDAVARPRHPLVKAAHRVEK